MINTIAAKWAEIETELIRTGGDKRVVAACRRVFYAGAHATLVVLAETFGETPPTPEQMMTQLETTRSEIMDTLRMEME